MAVGKFMSESGAESVAFGCEAPGCEFISAGWATEEQASARGAEHANEHKTGQLMTELTEFEASVGFVRGE